MINFRYHIVSIMAVFLALAVGIAVGVSLSPSVDQGILDQAQTDRDQVTALRTELARRDALDAYRNTYEQRSGVVVLAGEMTDQRVAVVAMPGAPGGVVSAITEAVGDAGGQVVTEVRVNQEIFDPTRAEQVDQAVAELTPVGLTDDMSPATRVGLVLARAVASKQAGARDDYSHTVGRTLAAAGLVDVRDDVTETAQLVIVVGAPTTVPVLDTDVVGAHVDLEEAIHALDKVALVVAGPNSDGLDGTDVGAVRTTSPASSELSTVDVADLASGVVTVVLAGKEQMLGRQGHYGALARADDVMPALPVR